MEKKAYQHSLCSVLLRRRRTIPRGVFSKMKEAIIRTPKEIYDRLGEDIVLIPLRSGKDGKRPQDKNWTRITIEETRKAEYVSKLCAVQNIGVVLGGNSNGLCTVDIDHDELVEPFMDSNPQMRHTFITKGKRGANFWFRAINDVPRTKKIEGVGELRGTGGQTVVCGTHPEGQQYRVLNDVAPIQANIEEIEFPTFPLSGSSIPKSLSKSVSGVKPTSKNYTYMASNDATTFRIEETTKRLECEGRVEEWKLRTEDDLSMEVVKMYEKHFEGAFHPDFSQRNKILIEFVTLKTGTICRELIWRIAIAFYENYQPIFKDPIDSHKKELRSHIDALHETFLASLPPEERMFIHSVDEVELDMFRICRDLASYEEKVEVPPPFFFLSCAELASRLLIDEKSAHRKLNKFQRLGFIAIKKKGTRRQKGQRGRATHWEWKLSLPVA